MNVGRRVGEIRAERGLTQEQLAEMLDVTLRHLQAVEGGSENLTVKTLASFPTALDVGIAVLFEPPQTPRPKRGRPKVTKTSVDGARQRRRSLANPVTETIAQLFRIARSRNEFDEDVTLTFERAHR